ncbi:hypothetical protein COW36_08960 [bacterium (Candidatus Blackallbacteria) CG17_big_fil_post_rev_8_21_14_2_50_48_46]|uniref:Uncharacterized protein n=1 Tax=bacterium (Candidatus Blackallbacteria) CG17_big_fil_post_rev_8_21_14_2_50_48_46 TaxID=2014261 RepID=A0A2M7G5Q3_9BACT|nr:MAG: hypothetical protein COW64_24090 [bacterium (Candidatus Blackallbacteria) CG18_big_fil_WC_8_21_14_2_50_49_26]PIW17298.1 MAG: hypothetical protein COW36_08960 [bacterium (Candidatus Blackallbacteria) CG17_big_fil_post_rev_8_21_14_2_50_48_46]PIW47471.1 MAG: hypothetical protein COW20_12870 [bacterium (Candidatus Blackallbacteria) CG13_big_fil_rev_8_21_14_2_50_49_14]
MATEYQRYQMQDGKTRLGQEYFNPVWQALDARLDRLEQVRLDWESAVADIQQFGLERIDATIAPILAEAQALLVEIQTLYSELMQLVEDIDIQGQIDTSLAAQTAWVEGAIAALEVQTEEAIEEAVSNIEGVPAGAIIIWTGTACPAGWVRATELDGFYLKGAADAAVPNLTPAGANTHSHSVTHDHSFPYHTHDMSHTHSGTTGAPNSASTTANSGFNIPIEQNHTHNFTTSSQSTSTTGGASGTTGEYSGSTGSQSNEPEHVTVLFCKKS